jgi:ABC-type uncharacterized transport system ATPase subunit
MITVNNIVKAYNGNIVVNIPQLATRQGEIIGLVGNNGAGKTTFFRLILDKKGRIIKDFDTTSDTLQELVSYFKV